MTPDSRRPAAVFFDLDDTLIAYESMAEHCWQDLCERAAPRLGVSSQALFAAIDGTRKWFWGDPARHRRGRLDLPAARREIMALAFEELHIDAPATADAIADAFTVEREERVELFPEAIGVLTQLREQGVRLALLTNGSAAFQRRKIERFGLEPLFDCIVIEGEFGAGKPEERVYRHALEQLAVAPTGTWMVGDNLEWDVAAPQRLGLFGIWFDALHAGLPADCAVRPDRIVRSLTELV